MDYRQIRHDLETRLAELDAIPANERTVFHAISASAIRSTLAETRELHEYLLRTDESKLAGNLERPARTDSRADRFRSR